MAFETDNPFVGDFQVFVDSRGARRQVPRGQAIVRSHFDSETPDDAPFRKLSLLKKLNPFADPTSLLYRRYIRGESLRMLAGPGGHASTAKRQLEAEEQRLRQQIERLEERNPEEDDDRDDDGDALGALVTLKPNRPRDGGHLLALSA